MCADAPQHMSCSFLLLHLAWSRTIHFTKRGGTGPTKSGLQAHEKRDVLFTLEKEVLPVDRSPYIPQENYVQHMPYS